MKEAAQAGSPKVKSCCSSDGREEEDGSGASRPKLWMWHRIPPSKQQGASDGWRAGMSGGAGAEGREASRDAIRRAMGS